MITVPPSLLAHPADLQRLASELLNLRFDGARLTEALLAMQQQARAVEVTQRVEVEALRAKDWAVDVQWTMREQDARQLADRWGVNWP